ncbi:MAG: hypothetical protein ABR562_02955 [Thermoplasmatota archaeon]|nr:hypothetical protein [Halobacteriales archaeon]
MPSQRKAPKKAARKPKKAAKRAKPDAEVVSKRDAPAREPGIERVSRQRRDVRAPVPRSTETVRHGEEADHMHRDPRWTQPKMDAKWSRAKHDPRKEYGLAKDRQVPRMNAMTNWFRKAPKPSSK